MTSVLNLGKVKKANRLIVSDNKGVAILYVQGKDLTTPSIHPDQIGFTAIICSI